MAITIGQIIAAAESVLDKTFKASEPASLLLDEAYIWIKEAFDIICEEARGPIKSDIEETVDGTRDYDLPSDIFDGIDGLEAVFYDDVFIERDFLQDVVRRSDDNTLESNRTVYLKEDSETKITILPTPDENGLEIKFIYVEKQALPSSTATEIPVYFEPFFTSISKYIIGRALEKDKQGSGVSYIAEFEARVKKKARGKYRTSQLKDLDNLENPDLLSGGPAPQ